MSFETSSLCDGYVDNDVLRMAVSRGSSAKLGHLRVHADTCFRIAAQLPISLHKVSTTENEADIMTKVLSKIRYRDLCKTDLCRHTGWKSLESRTRSSRPRAQPHSC